VREAVQSQSRVGTRSSNHKEVEIRAKIATTTTAATTTASNNSKL